MSEAAAPDPGETRRTIGDEVWRGTAATLEALAAAMAEGAPAVVIKENRRRNVTRYALPGGGHVFVKRFRDSGVGQTLKAMALGTRAQREVRWARELSAGGIAVAEPLAWADHSDGKAATGAVAHRGVEDAIEAIELVHDPGVDPARRQRLLHEIAMVLRKAHDLGIGFRDFHLGNVLVGPGDTLVLIDLQSAWRPGPLLGRVRLINLAMALTSIPRRAWPQARRALRSYGPVPGLSEREVARWAAERATKMIRRHFRSRSERCLRDSTEFVVEHRGGWRIFRRRDFDGELIAKLPSQGLKGLETGGPHVLKDARESAVVRGLTLGQTPVIAKRYLPRGGLSGVRQWLGHGRGRRAWVAGNTCKALGVPVALPIALLEGGGGEAWMIMQDLADHESLDRRLWSRWKDEPPARRASFARALGTALGESHAKGVLHADWKGCNIMVGPDDAVAFVDYDRVAFLQLWGDRPLNRAEAVEGLRQLNCSVPRAVSRTDRMRFLKHYATAVERPDFGGLKELFSAVWEASKPHKILSVSPEGDVHETWQ